MAKKKSPPVRRVKDGAGPEASLYERIGAEKVERLVAALYVRVDRDPVIRRFSRDAKGQTPLRRAVNCRQLQIVRVLVRRGADPHAADHRGVTPLDVARTAEMKQALAEAGA